MLPKSTRFVKPLPAVNVSPLPCESSTPQPKMCTLSCCCFFFSPRLYPPVKTMSACSMSRASLATSALGAPVNCESSSMQSYTTPRLSKCPSDQLESIGE